MTSSTFSCTFQQWLPSKARMFHCTLPAYLGTSSSTAFCAIHLPAGVVCPVKGERVECPFSSSHLLWKTRLEKHLLTCDVRISNEKKKKKTINKKSGDSHSGNRKHEREEKEREDEEDETMHNAKKKLRASETTDEDVRSIQKLLNCYSLPPLSISSTLHPSFSTLFPECPVEEKHLHKKSHNRHSLQQSSLLMHMHKHHLLLPGVVLEFGCGTAKLSLHLQHVLNGNCSHLLVDMQAFKRHSRKDEQLKANLAEGEWLRRLQIDIKDLQLDEISELRGRYCMCISKHLCGPATDFALRTVVNYADKLRGEQDAGMSVSFATCCHYLCSWESYVNPQFFIARNFGPEDFRLICVLSNWATLDNGSEDDEHVQTASPKQEIRFTTDSYVEHVSTDASNAISVVSTEHKQPSLKKLTRDEKFSLGQKCKQLIDEGRSQFLRGHGFVVSLARYTSLSKENLVILGKQELLQQPVDFVLGATVSLSSFK